MGKYESTGHTPEGCSATKTHLLYATLVAAAAIVLPRAALAEFQIQEASIERGETEFEYRGAYHWGVPQVTDNNPNANDLVQSHEFEFGIPGETYRGDQQFVKTSDPP